MKRANYKMFLDSLIKNMRLDRVWERKILCGFGSKLCKKNLNCVGNCVGLWNLSSNQTLISSVLAKSYSMEMLR